MFIYQALFEAFTCGVTSIDISDFIEENQKLRQNKINNQNGYQLQFEVRNTFFKMLLLHRRFSEIKGLISRWFLEFSKL